MNIFGIAITPVSQEQVLQRVQKSIRTGTLLRIVTVNPEFLLEAFRNHAFAESLKTADIRTTDGVGLQLMARITGEKLTRVTGANLTQDLLALAEEQGVPVIIFNSPQGLSTNEKIEEAVRVKHPSLKILFDQTPTNYSFVFCTYGAPTQELFLQGFTVPSLYMGVGGSFDYLTGAQKRAPLLLRALGLEWLWRFILQPKRIKRIWRATVVFPLLFWREKMLH